MRDIILEYIINRFGEDRFGGDRTQHYSYCSFPEEKCSCKNLIDITYDTSLIHGGYIDSFSMVGVLFFLEDRFKINVPEKLATPEYFDTVDKMVELINNIKQP